MSVGLRMFWVVEIEIGSIEQANAVYDVVEHRVLTAPSDTSLSELEAAEVMELVAFMLRLRRLIAKDQER